MDQHYNHNQSRSEETYHRTKTRKRARRWDAILVGIVFSIAFVLLLTKVAQTTPCEVISHFNIGTKTCALIGNANTMEARIASQHGLGFDIIFEYELLTSELSEELMDQAQGYLHEVGLK